MGFPGQPIRQRLLLAHILRIQPGLFLADSVDLSVLMTQSHDKIDSEGMRGIMGCCGRAMFHVVLALATVRSD